jgi:hypothetical protein
MNPLASSLRRVEDEFRPSEVLAAFRCDPATGEITSRYGNIVGSRVNGGYLAVKLAGRTLLAHRVVWVLCHGEWPAETIDHINGNPADNRLCNLRLATWSENNANRAVHRHSKTGVKGVDFRTHAQRYRAQIKVEGSIPL